MTFGSAILSGRDINHQGRDTMKLQQLVALLFGVGLVFWAQVGSTHDSISEATYLGNEAIHFKYGNRSVLFDSFFTDGLGYYSVVDDKNRALLSAGFPPFDTVVLVFVSHVHPDHFSPGMALQYLRDNKKVILFAPGQVVDSLLLAGGIDIAKRLIRVALTPGQAPFRIEREGIDIAAIAIPHKGGAQNRGVENLVFRVAIDDSVTVAHFGDSAEEGQWFEVQQKFLSPIDVALIPYWFFQNPQGRELIASYLLGKQVVGMHVPKFFVGSGDEHTVSAQGDLFVDIGEVRQLNLE